MTLCFCGVVLFFVNAEDDGDVFIGRRCGDDYFLYAVGEVAGCFFGVGEEAGRFDDDFDAGVVPGDFGRVAFGEHDDFLTVDDQGSVSDFDFAVVASVCGVVFEEVCLLFGVGEVVDRDYLQLVGMTLADGSEDLPSDSAEAVDTNLGSAHVCGPGPLDE